MDGKKKYFKDGNPDVFRWFTELTWKYMTEGERAMWTPYNEDEPAPIPEDVLEFQKKSDDFVRVPTEEYEKLMRYARELGTANARIAELEALCKDAKCKAACAPGTERIEPVTDEEKREALKAELKKRGIKFTHNSKLETLQKKLDDADNTE